MCPLLDALWTISKQLAGTGRVPLGHFLRSACAWVSKGNGMVQGSRLRRALVESSPKFDFGKAWLASFFWIPVATSPSNQE